MTLTRVADAPPVSQVRWARGRAASPLPRATSDTVDGRKSAEAAALDAALLHRVADGDDAALGDLYDRHAPLALGIATRLIGDRSLAQDAVQETFVSVWRNAATFDATRSPVRSWIAMIVRRRAIDAIRRRRPSDPLEHEAVQRSLPIVPDVWAAVSERLDRDAIRQAMASLAPRQREVLELAYFGGLTQAEIADRTGAPLGTVKSRARLGLLSLRERMLPGR